MIGHLSYRRRSGNTFHSQSEILADEAVLLASISELADEAGLSIDTVVHYEAIGRIEPIMIGATRRYGETARLRLKLIRKGKQIGFSLQEIQRLVAAGDTH